MGGEEININRNIGFATASDNIGPNFNVTEKYGFK